MARSLSREVISTKREKIAKLAREKPKLVLTTLAHNIDVGWLREAYRRTRKDGAVGVDGVTSAQYETNLEENLTSLLERFKTGKWLRAGLPSHPQRRGRGSGWCNVGAIRNQPGREPDELAREVQNYESSLDKPSAKLKSRNSEMDGLRWPDRAPAVRSRPAFPKKVQSKCKSADKARKRLRPGPLAYRHWRIRYFSERWSWSWNPYTRRTSWTAVRPASQAHS